MKKYLSLVLLIMGLSAGSVMGQNITFAGSLSDTSNVPPHKELLIPNAFTPNNDGQNDFFKILNLTNEKLIDFKVFNRWGTILFRTTDPKQGWDGTYRGQPQPLGVYGYVIRIGYEDNYVETYKGTVTLLK